MNVWRGLAFMVLGGCSLVARDVGQPVYAPAATPEDHVRLATSAALRPLAEMWAGEFRRTHPEWKIEVASPGSDVAVARLYTAQADAALLGRPLTDQELKAYEWIFRTKPERIDVGTGPLHGAGQSAPLLVYVHADNPLRSVALDQLDAIFSSERRRGAPNSIATWGDLGLRGEWAGQPIRFYAPHMESGTGRFFRRAVLGDSRQLQWERLREFSDRGELQDLTHDAGAQALDALALDQCGLAIAPDAPGERAVRALPIALQVGAPPVDAGETEVGSRAYPLARPIYLHVHRSESREASPALDGFLHWLQSPAGSEATRQAGYFPPPLAAATPLALASSATTDDLAQKWAAAFAVDRSAPAPVKVVSGRYPTDALAALIAKKADIALVAREPYATELAAARAAGLGALRFLPLATGSRAQRGGTHAIAVFVHKSNPLGQLGVDQLREILADDGRVRRWGDLGVTGPLATQPIVVHGQPTVRATGTPPGIVNFLAWRVLESRAWRRDLVAHDDAESVPALESIVRAVAQDPAAIGLSGFDYGVPGAKTLALGEIAAGPFHAGSREEIENRHYPLTRTVFLCLPENPSPRAGELAQFLVSPAGQREISQSASGFFPLPEAMRSAVAATLEASSYRTEHGAIRITGYNDMREMVEAWTAGFTRLHPELRFSLDLPSTRAAIPAVASGQAAFGPMGAELSAAQRVQFREIAGVEPWQFRVALASLDSRALSGPLAVFVPESSALRELSLPQLAAIFEGRDSATGLAPCGMAPATALGEFFATRVMRGKKFAAGYVAFGQSVEVIDHVATNSRAIGFAAAMRAKPGVRVLALAPDDGEPAVPLSTENVVERRYPLRRHLWLLVKPPLDDTQKEFLRFVLSDEGQRMVGQGSLGYLPLSPEEREAELRRIQ